MRPRTRRCTIALAPLLLLALAAGIAHAQDEPDDEPGYETQVENLADRGVEFYQAQQYHKALKFFLEAYRMDPVPDLLFNIAKVYEKLEEPSLATEYYEQYVRSEDATPELKVKALQEIRALEAAVEAEEAEAEAEEEEEPPPPPPPPPRTRLHVPGYASLAAGGALAVAGAVFGGMALQKQGLFQDAAYRNEKVQFRDQAESRAKVADICFGAAAVAATAGVVLLILDPGPPPGEATQPEEPEAALSVTPSFGAASGGVLLGGRF